MRNWKLRYRPRRWQTEALEKWKRGLRGTVRVVTGGGKTVFAELCLEEFFRDRPAARALIVVPTIALLDQWYIALQEELGVSPGEIGLLSGEEKPAGTEPILIAVINTARNFAAQFAEERPAFLVVDECHRAGSPANARALEGNFKATLGLSATPEREYDDGFREVIEPRLGPVIFEYTYKHAATDEVISPFRLINVQIDLLADEAEKYQRLTRSIGRAFKQRKVQKPDDVIKRLLQRRAAVSANATMRIPVAAKLVEQHRGERAVIFHERIDAANAICSVLNRRGHRATAYHAEIGPTARRDNLRLFRKGAFDILVCCRALDEGMNVPEANVAVVASSTASQRQRIQRLGRILRKAKGKKEATVYTLFATKDEQERLKREEQNLEGITNVAWLKGKAERNG